jgi:hypothetical protein
MFVGAFEYENSKRFRTDILLSGVYQDLTHSILVLEEARVGFHIDLTCAIYD